jgi:hypothetical protein
MLGQTLAAVSLRLHHIDSLPAASSHRPIAFSRKGLTLGCRHSMNNAARTTIQELRPITFITLGRFFNTPQHPAKDQLVHRI